DSTVNYLTGKNTPAIDFNDREIDSPYNTYKYQGLPPGPICNPSLDAIIATVRPVESDYWYFLNRLDTGASIFSKTYAEHLANKEKYLK
ncbi:MAG: endolytic transglycosylase MltG, partial [Acidobacteria bacterium]|nr:endolytic transglycosylase MltG [Acidobacteriota bacterium]